MEAVERDPVEQAGEPSCDTLWTVADAAHYLRVSRSWIYQGVAAGRIPHMKVGALVRFDPEAFRAWCRGEDRAAKVVHLPGRKR